MKKIIALLLTTTFILITNFTVNAEAKTPFKKLALTAPGAETNKAAEINNDGIRHFSDRHYSEGGEYFEKALKMDPNLAEAHFNLGLVLHKKKKHGNATEHFKKAAELAPDDPRIQNSEILKHHIGGGHKGMKSEDHEEMMHGSGMSGSEMGEHKGHMMDDSEMGGHMEHDSNMSEHEEHKGHGEHGEHQEHMEHK